MSDCLATPWPVTARCLQRRPRWKRHGLCWTRCWWSTTSPFPTRKEAGAHERRTRCWGHMAPGTTPVAKTPMQTESLLDQQYRHIDHAQQLGGDRAEHHTGDSAQTARTHDDRVDLLLLGIVGNRLRHRADQNFFFVLDASRIEDGLGRSERCTAFVLVERLDFVGREEALDVTGHDGRIGRDEQQLCVSELLHELDRTMNGAARVFGPVDRKKNCLHC